MTIDTVLSEVIGEGSQHQLVKDAALVDAEVVLHFIVAPIGEILWVIIDLQFVRGGDLALDQLSLTV